MSVEPLQPFSPPTAVFNFFHFSGVIAPSVALEVLLYAVFALWAVYTLVAIYHWLRFSHASFVALPAIAAHLFVSFALATYILTGNRVL